LAGAAFFAGAFFAAFFAVAMIDFLLEVDVNHQLPSRLAGRADAKGEKPRFQAKKGFFHWGVLLFHSGGGARFALAMRNTPSRMTPQAIHSAAVTVSEASQVPSSRAITGFTKA